MADLVRLLFLAPIGFIIAIFAAAMTVAFAAAGADTGFNPNVARDIGDIFGPGGIVLFAGVIMLFAGAASFIPAVVAIAVAELFAIRSALFFLLVGGAIGFVIHQFAPFAGPEALLEARALAFPAAGFVGGGVYWLIAGRLSGIGRDARAPRPIERNEGDRSEGEAA